MDHFSHFFSSNSISLELVNEESSAALQEVAGLLKQDPRVLDWKSLSQALSELTTPLLEIDKENSVAIYHLRTNNVQDLVMAAGRSIPGVFFQDSKQLIRLIIVIGIPHALSQEYLRALGSLVRSLKEPTTFKKLLSTENPDEFMTLLSQPYE